MAHLEAVANVATSNALYDRVISLRQEIESIEFETGSALTDVHHIAWFDSAEELADAAEFLAAEVKGSKASEEEHKAALLILAAIARAKEAMPHMIAPDTLAQDDRDAVAEIKRYWRVQGLEGQAAEAAAALEIAEARKGYL